MEIVQIVTLAISGLLLTMVGALRLSNPIKNYEKNSGIKLNNEVDLLNEVRGVSALMLSGGIIALLGTFMGDLSLHSHVVTILIFLGFAIGRLISFGADGKPNKQIVQGLVSELVLGGANLFCLISMIG